ncbi:YY1-associated factor 2 isoform X4 [Leucoraja erinacea]|uniref:YY1-associated factor 2 isoform X4 n=1 Tax=Leucoraja erinaceus TaxID=7782 RepID=UPI0024555DB7|nr:YY1-associated factor 2 isoform X4 [Leucoraja erinacea]
MSGSSIQCSSHGGRDCYSRQYPKGSQSLPQTRDTGTVASVRLGTAQRLSNAVCVMSGKAHQHVQLQYNKVACETISEGRPSFGRTAKQPGCSRKPRPVSQLVAQQVTQQFASPTQPKKEKKDKGEKEKTEKEVVSKKKSHKKIRPRLKNVDRSSAQHLEVTVGDLTVIITDFKEKVRSAPAATATSSTTGEQHSLSSSSSDNTEKGLSRSSSPRADGSVNGESH